MSHHITRAEALEKMQTNEKAGLSRAEAVTRRARCGKNVLIKAGKKSLVGLFFSQFADFMVLTLLFAAGVSFFAALLGGEKDFLDPLMILVIVLLNAAIGAAQERRAEGALEALEKMQLPHARALRSGHETRILTEDIVPGDLLFLSAGDIIPADGVTLEAFALAVDEASLTGESHPILKSDDPGAPSPLYSGTAVVAGRGRMLVTSTGMQTEMGRIAAMLTENQAPETPLQKRLAHVSVILGAGALVVCAAVFFLGLLRGMAAGEIFLTAVSLAVAAIPEGLPAVVTVMLSLGVRRMAARHAIVRRLPAVETLGSATVICTDKTGTLTQNTMKAVAFVGEKRALLTAAILASNGSDPTEKAILRAGEACELDREALFAAFPRLSELPFSSERKRMTVVLRTPAGYRVIMKGGADVVLGFTLPSPLASTLGSMTQKGLRVLAVASYQCDTLPASPEEHPFTLLGLIGCEDPVRPEAINAVRVAGEAGILPVMITGDHRATAEVIARQTGILTEGRTVLTGEELDRLSDAALVERLDRVAVFARTTPAHKLRIVNAFRAKGEVVAMTGDGVNDAPALKAADIGLAMGQGGTAVAAAAADMVLTDSDFSTIVAAVEEGRAVYQNIRRALQFLLSSNIGEILTIFLSLALFSASPLSPIQLLWINLVTDSLPALALGREAPEKDAMRRAPIRPGESLFAGGLAFEIGCEGCVIGLLALGAYLCGLLYCGGAAEGSTMCFLTLGLSQLVHAFNAHSTHSLFTVNPFSNRYLNGAFLLSSALQAGVVLFPMTRALFAVTALSPGAWGIVAALSLVPILFTELYKYLTARF